MVHKTTLYPRNSCQSPSSVCNTDALIPHPQLATFDAHRTFLALDPEGSLFACIQLSPIMRDIRPFICGMCVSWVLYVRSSCCKAVRPLSWSSSLEEKNDVEIRRRRWTRRCGSVERDCKRTGGVLADVGRPSLCFRLIDMTGVFSKV